MGSNPAPPSRRPRERLRRGRARGGVRMHMVFNSLFVDGGETSYAKHRY